MVLNEVNCSGSDWVELLNTGPSAVSIGSWLLTDDPLDAVRDGHGVRLPAGTVLAPGAFYVVPAGASGFSFDLVCGTSTVSLADASGALVDSYALPSLAKSTTTLGRIPDGTGGWQVTVPTPAAANAVPVSSMGDPSWLYNPLQVTQIDLTATPSALAQLSADPTTYVDARVTIHNGSTNYGPYAVGLKLKGHASFRNLDGKAALKVKFGYSVSGQKFGGLKGLTLNNMVQDPSMIAEAISSLLVGGIGSPTARVGYAYVRLNGAEYGLYSDVETVDSVMAKRWFSTTQHIYEANYANDVGPGHAADFQVQEGSDTDLSDLEALGVADAGGATGWSDRMQPVADLTEMTRAWAAEHYIGQWDGYSYGAMASQPNNYYLQDDSSGRFTMIISGTDQTWLDRPSFGAYANGVMMRHCVSDNLCRQLYVDQLRQIAASPVPTQLPGEARAILATIAPWRAQDPRREQSETAGLAQAEDKIATMQARPAELAAWLADPSFVDVSATSAAGGGGGAPDLTLTGSVSPDSAPIGASHVWRLQVANTGGGTATDVTLAIELSPNVVVGFTQVPRGEGCVTTSTGLTCALAELGPPGSGIDSMEVVVGTNVSGPGKVTLAATASFSQPDPTPADNSLQLTTNVPPATGSAPFVPTAQVAITPHLGKPTAAPAKPVAGKRFTFTLPVTRSDNRRPLRTGTMSCNPSIAGKVVRHTDSFAGGKAHLSLVVPKRSKGKALTIRITVTAAARSVHQTYKYAIR